LLLTTNADGIPTTPSTLLGGREIRQTGSHGDRPIPIQIT
jgi:hypothetical protein